MADALPNSIELVVVTPDRLVVEAAVSAVTIPGASGYLGVLPGHAPLLTELDIGRVTYTRANGEHAIAVARGFAEVLPGRVVILADTAERAEEIDAERAERARQRAEEELRKMTQAGESMDQAREALRRAISRLETAHHKTS